MSKHWRPDPDVRWLRPEDYARLSPQERRSLWRARRRDGVSPRASRWQGKGYYARRRWSSFAIVACAMALGGGTGILDAVMDRAAPAPAAVSRASEVANFGFCHSGGGVNCVVDGDTFYLGGEKVRIAGIDAPETHDYGCASEKALGDRATAELRALLNSGAVTMTSIDRDRDVYGRLLRNVAVDGADVSEALIGAGMAREFGSGRRGWC